ncbi:MAG: hypothetical protein IIU51_08920 [Bacteroidaceae bacterium]|nr:hypothetical protein [Bacteroidaceae bacterium]
MAQKYKVDPSKIDGFDKMTADEKVAALLGQEIEVDAPLESSEVIKLKNAYNKACEEAGNYRKQLREKQSEAERADADRAEQLKAMQDELASYRNKERVSSYKAQLMAAGIDPDTADLMAKSLPEGVSDEYFQATKSFLDAQRKNAEIAALGKQPSLSVGTPPKGMTKEDEIVAIAMKSAGLA